MALRHLGNLPVNHVGCLLNLTCAALVTGGSIAFQPRFDAAEVSRLIERHRVTTWLQVPTMFSMVLGPGQHEGCDLSSLRAVAVGGGPLGADLLARLRAITPNVFIEHGQTELMSTVSLSPAGASDEVLTGTVGRPAPEIELRIADEASQALPPGETGEIQARGACCMLGYWGDEAATRAAFAPGGWLRTSDLGHLRPDWMLVLRRRIGEMIKSGGYNVHLRKVELALEADRDVAEAAVFDRPDPVYVEAAHAAMAPAPSAAPDGEALRKRCLAWLGLPTTRCPRASRCSPPCPACPTARSTAALWP